MDQAYCYSPCSTEPAVVALCCHAENDPMKSASGASSSTAAFAVFFRLGKRPG